MRLPPAIVLAALTIVATAAQALAQGPVEMAPASETSRYLFGALLSFAAIAAGLLLLAGFAAREAGMVRTKNIGASCVKAVALLSGATLAVWLVGYNLIFTVEPGGFLGAFAIFVPTPAEEGAPAQRDFLKVALAAAAGLAIVAGAVAERMRFWPFIVFGLVYAALIFPIAASWLWGGGYLAAAWKVSDFSGVSLVHVCGGWAALAGAVIVGPRLARYEGEEARDLPAANAGLVAMGGMLAWLALMGLNASARGALASAEDGVAISTILINSQLAAAAAVVAAIVLTEIIYKRTDLVILVNAAIGGLVAIAAGPLAPALWQAVIIGAFSGAIVTVTRPLLDRLRIDDAVGAVPTHLLCGIWGVLIVPWSNAEATYLGQLAGIVIIGAFALTMSILLWTVLRYTAGVRVSADREIAGLDMRAAAAPKPKL